MTTIDQTYTIAAPIAKVWQALTDATIMDQWDAGPVTMDPTVGGTFSLWDGDIHGTNTVVEVPTQLRQDWYGHDHPERKYDVTFILTAAGDTTTVHLTHTAQDDDAESMADGWRDYYFQPIKQLLEAK